MSPLTKDTWLTYCENELALVAELLARHGYSLAAEQPHLKGERFLMQAATTAGGVKLILFGQRADGQKVVIKATRDAAGQAELRHERRCRDVLHELKFAAEVFHTPAEVAWIEEAGFFISIQAYIDQVSTFLERPLAEQFDLALTAFKAQEGTHATTSSHHRLIAGVYEERTSKTYLAQFAKFKKDIKTGLPEETELHDLFSETEAFLTKNGVTIDQYCGFLTHTDFVPHNIRINAAGTMYLLDHSSLTFGNKHEGWARFINFMTLYNGELATALTTYMEKNRAPEEQKSLTLMRCYRLGEIIWYYQNKLPVSEGNLHTLNRARVDFWAEILRRLLTSEPIPPTLIATYTATRDGLRSKDEQERQKGLH